jgi:hypothetical protein
MARLPSLVTVHSRVPSLMSRFSPNSVEATVLGSTSVFAPSRHCSAEAPALLPIVVSKSHCAFSTVMSRRSEAMVDSVSTFGSSKST